MLRQCALIKLQIILVKKKDACRILEQKLKKSLLAFACHYINKVIISNIFNSCYETSTGPDILLKGLQTSWDQIDKSNYQTESLHLIPCLGGKI